MATRKVTVNLPESVVGLLKGLAEERETTITEALRQSIEITTLLRREVAEGGRILVEREDGPTRLLLLP